MDEQMMKERREATYRARAAAWEAEKAEAQANKVGAEDLPAALLLCILMACHSNVRPCQAFCCFIHAPRGPLANVFIPTTQIQ